MNERPRRIGFIVPWPDEDRTTRFGVPIGVLYLCAVLERQGWLVELQRPPARGALASVDWASFLRRHWLFGVSIPGYARSSSSEVLQSIRASSPDAVILVGGPEVSLRRRLSPLADVGIIGEAEDRIAAVAESLRRRERPEAHGVMLCDSLAAVQGPGAFVPRDLDALPFPARHLIDGQEDRAREWGRLATTILTARGCAGRCAFCARPAISGNRYRTRSVTSVVDELEALQASGYRTVAIIDDNFLFDSDRVREIMGLIVARRLKLEITLSGWAREHEHALYVLMHQAGVRAISFGLESGSDRVLDLYHKGLRRDSIVEALSACNEAGIYTIGNFIFGAPDETLSDMEATFQFILALPLDNVKLKVLGYTHGSELWASAHRRGLVQEEEFNVLAGSERGLSPVPSAEIMAFCREATRRFHQRPEHQHRLREKLLRWGAPYSVPGTTP